MWQQRVGGENLQDKNSGNKMYVFTCKKYMFLDLNYIIIIVSII